MKKENEHNFSTCSVQDCTGLIPSGPVEEEELEDYEELYPFLPKVPKASSHLKDSNGP